MRSFRAPFLALALTTIVAAGLTPAVHAQATKTSSAKPAAGPVDLNTATEEQLVALPGVGKATAKKIIAGRPFSSVSDLSRVGVPAKTITQLTPLVTVSTNTRPAPAASGAPAAAPAPKTAAKTATKPTSDVQAQTPPAPGMVWVNTETKVFHREGDRYYGKTKHGKFMTEADAVKAGYREAKSNAKAK